MFFFTITSFFFIFNIYFIIVTKSRFLNTIRHSDVNPSVLFSTRYIYIPPFIPSRLLYPHLFTLLLVQPL